MSQTDQDFEICISDDCSTDGRAHELEAFLCSSGMSFKYFRQEKNLRYDANLRAAISLASGRYCLLMGNDDCLADDSVLSRLKYLLEPHPEVGVAILNYEEYAERIRYRRAARTATCAGGPDIASIVFRNLSFVSGVVLRRDRAVANTTAKWDGSEMYQMYLGCRILAEGYDLLEVSDFAIRKGIALRGETVDSYAAKAVEKRCPIIERPIPLARLAGLVCDAIEPHCQNRRMLLSAKVYGQVICFTYPFWILEYRRVQSWRYALGVCLGMRPRNLFAHHRPPFVSQLFLSALYGITTTVGLTLPSKLFFANLSMLHRAAKAAWR